MVQGWASERWVLRGSEALTPIDDGALRDELVVPMTSFREGNCGLQATAVVKPADQNQSNPLVNRRILNLSEPLSPEQGSQLVVAQYPYTSRNVALQLRQAGLPALP